MARLHALVADHADDPADVTVATETDRGLFVGAMVATGYRVLAINPMSVARYRQRLSTSGAKSDQGDARVLAELARTDGHNHRPVAGDSGLVEAVKVLARTHLSLIWSPPATCQPARSMLREFYPAALDAFEDLSSSDALAVLGIAPTPPQGRRLSKTRMRGCAPTGEAASDASTSAPPRSTARCGSISRRRRWSPKRWEPPSAPLVAITVELVTQIGRIETELADRLNKTRTPRSSAPLPGLGMILGARVLASSGTTPTGSTAPSLARTTPERRRSPGHQANIASFSPDTPETSGSPTPPTSGPSPPSPPARSPPLLRPAARRRRHPQQALRALANRLIGILHGCLTTRTHYDEHTAWAHRQAAAA